MHRPKKEAQMRRRRQLVVVLMFAAAVSVALIAAASGSAGGTHSASGVTGPSGWVGSGGTTIGKGGGYGESYTAPSPTLTHALFQANLLPANKTARNISLAAYGRSTKTVNYTLALNCWKNNGCSTGTNGKYTVAYVEGFGENTYRQMSKMEFILDALTYPSDRQDHLPERPLGPQPGDRGLQVDDRAARERDRHLPRLRRRHAAGVPAGDEGRDSRLDLRLGLRHRAGHELHDGGRRGHVQARPGVRGCHERNRQDGQHRVPRRLPGQPAVARLAEVRAGRPQLQHQGRRERADELGSVEGPGHRLGHPREDS